MTGWQIHPYDDYARVVSSAAAAPDPGAQRERKLHR